MQTGIAQQTGRRLIGQGNININVSLPPWAWDLVEEKGGGKRSVGLLLIIEEYVKLTQNTKVIK